MNRPEVQKAGGVYVLRWEDIQVTATIDRIREDSHHMVSGEITVKSNAPGTTPHLHGPARLNLTSTASRHTLAKTLGERLDHLDWYAVVEQACVLVLEDLRVGEPVIDLSIYTPSEQIQYRLAPLLVEKQANLFYGPGGVGKSYLAAFLALLVDLPWTCAGFTPEPGKVLYLDYEAGADELHERLTHLRAGLGIDIPTQVFYRFCHQPLANDIAELQRLIAEHGIELVVVDSVGLACGVMEGGEGFTSAALAYFRALRSLRVTSLSIDHISKDKSLFGSVYKINLSRSVWEIKKSQEIGEGQLHLGLFHRKVNRGMLQHPIGLSFNFREDGAVSVTREDVRDVPGLATSAPLKDRIAGELRRGAMNVKELAEELDTREEVIRVTLNRHTDKMFVKRGDSWGNLAETP